MASDGTITIDTSVDNSGAQKGIDKLKSTADKGLKAIGVSLGAMAGIAVKTSIDTEQSFAKVNSILQLNKESINGTKSEWDKYSDSLKQGAKDVRMAYSDYADAAYQAISAGVEQANVNDFLNQSYQLAKGGLTDLTTATDLLTTVQNAYSLSQEDMVEVSDILIQTQNKGKTTVDELGASMGKIIPTANGLNVDIAQLGAGYALMTSKGIATAETTTYMNSMFNELGKSGTKVDKALRELSGKSFAELQESGLSVADALDILNQYAEKNNLSLADMFGSAEAAKAAQVLLGDSVDETTGEIIKGERSAKAYNDMLKDMENSAGSCNKAFIEMNETTKEKLTQAFADLKNKLSDVAEKSLPVLADGLKWIVDNGEVIVSTLAGIGTSLLVFNVAAIIGDFIAVMKGAEAATKGVAIAQGLLNAVMNANIFVLIGTLIVGLVAGLVTLWNTNEDFRNAVTSAWEHIKQVGEDCWNSICNFFTETVPNAFQGMCDFFTGIPEWFSDLWNRVTDTFNQWGEDIGNFFNTTIPQWIENIRIWFSELPYKIGEGLGSVIGTIANWGVETWTYLTTNVPLWIEGITTWFSELPGRIETWLRESISKVVTWGTETYNKASEAVSNTINAVGIWFSELPGKINTWLTESINKMTIWISNMVAKGKEAAKKTVDTVVEGFKGLPDKIKEIGVGLVKGLWNGITSMGDWLYKQVTSFANGVIDGFKKTFKINSPSKVMIEIGKWIDEGLAEGIADNADSVKKATKKVTDAIEKEIEEVKKLRDKDVTSLEKSLKGATKSKQEAIREQIKLRKQQADDEIKELKRISTMSKEQLQEELNARKEFAKEVNNLEKAITDALKEKYKQEYDAQTESINNQLSNLDRWKKESIDRINSVYDAKIDAIDAELKALDQAEKEKDRLEAENTDLDKIKRLEEAIAFEHDETNKAQLEKELEKVKKEREKRLEEEALEDKKEALKAQKEELEEKRQNEIDNINAIYESEKEFYQNRLDEAKKFYNDRTNEAKIQAEAEKLIVDKNQKEIVALINSYAPQWKDAGKSLGDRLVEGMKPSIDAINNMISSIWSSINAAQSAAKSISVPTSKGSGSTINNSNTRSFNINVNGSSSNSTNDIEVAMRRMAFSID